MMKLIQLSLTEDQSRDNGTALFSSERAVTSMGNVVLCRSDLVLQLILILRHCLFDYVICSFSQPSHNDKTANPEMSKLMSELAKSRKQLKGRNLPVDKYRLICDLGSVP